jgi:hypothetical protein
VTHKVVEVTWRSGLRKQDKGKEDNMALDLEAIKRRVAQLNGEKTTSAVQLWKPGIGTYIVRAIPWPSALLEDGMPFIERWQYYLGKECFLSPKQFGKPDPIDEFLKKLWSSKNPEDREQAKEMSAKMKAYVPIIVRGEEAKGVQVWAMSKTINSRMLGFFVDEWVGDILHPEKGRDLKVTISQVPGKSFKGKPTLDTKVDAAPAASKLSSWPGVTEEQVSKWLASTPNIDDMWKPRSTKEIEAILTKYLSGDAEPSHEGGETRGPQVQENLDALQTELKAEAPAAASPKAETKTKSKTEKSKTDASKSAIDAAFDELNELG